MRAFLLIVTACVVGCSIYPGMPFEATTVVRNELKPGCYRNVGNWIRTDYPEDWHIEYDWRPIDCE